MKKTRLAVILVLVVLCAASWLRLGGQVLGKAGRVSALAGQARAYQEQRLYALAADAYLQAIEADPSRELYDALLATCRDYYAEEHTSSVKKKLLAAYESAVAEYPKEAAYWEGYAQVYLDAGSCPNAVAVLEKAAAAHAESETLDAQWRQAYYGYKTLYKAYEQISLREQGGVYAVSEGGLAGTVDAACKPVQEMQYRYVGPAGEDDAVLCVTEDDEVRLFSKKGVMIARFQAPVEEARGYGCGLIPVRLRDRSDWCYLDLNGNEVCGGFAQAGMFQKNTAAAQLPGGEWCLIDTEGSQKSENTWQEVRLDESGRYRQDSVVMLKTDGVWKLYTASGKEKEGFSCQDIDICCDGGYIAFEQGGRWGFVDTDGKVVIEPRYEAARSFSGGVAAVCSGGVWSFIDEAGVCVAEGAFADAGYFSAESGTCPVMPDDGAGEWRLIAWRVAR